MDADQLRDRLARVLLTQLSKDQYPSATAMEVLDQLSGSTRLAYAAVLLDKIEQDAYPSSDMVKRVTSLLSSA